MNFRTTAILIGALAVVVLALVVVKVREETGDQPVEARTLLGIKTEDVAKVAINPKDGQRVVIEKQGTEWRLMEPIQAAAETWAVDGLVRAIAEMKSRGEAEANSASGLDQPRYLVELTAKSGKTAKVKVGNVSTVGGNLYVQPEGESSAILVSADVNEQLVKPYTSLRQTRLVNLQAADIQRMTIARPERKVSVEKVGGDWQVVEPTKMPAESSEVSSLTSAVGFMNAVEYVDEADVPALVHPKNNPRLTVWVSKEAPTTQPATTQPAGVTLTFGGYESIDKTNVYVSVSEPKALAKVAASALDSFNKTPLDLRDRRVVNIEPGEVSRVEIVREMAATTQPTTKPAERVETVIERKKDSATTQATTMAATQPTTMATTAPALPPTKWALVSPSAGDASQSTVEGLLGKFHPLRAQKYLEPAATPSTQPAATYVVRVSTQAAGGASSAVHEIRLRDEAPEKPLIGEYDGLRFEVERSLAQSLGQDFANKAETRPEDAMPAMPPGLGGIPGLPPGHP